MASKMRLTHPDLRILRAAFSAPIFPIAMGCIVYFFARDSRWAYQQQALEQTKDDVTSLRKPR
jgi:hypothetical protein